MEVRKKFFRERVLKHWHRLPTERVEWPSLKCIEKRVALELRDTVW